ncbi:MAG: helix-turn-helix domain-containing protein [Ignavibacteriales bacterium]
MIIIDIMKQLEIDRTKNTAEELRRLYKNEKNPRVQRKLLGIKMMVEEDLSSYEVSQRLSVSPTTARKWLKRYNESGYEGLLHRYVPGGRLNITDQEFLSIIEEIDLGNPQWTLQRIALLTQKRHNRGLKKSAVWLRLKKMGIHGKVAEHTIRRRTSTDKLNSRKKG